MSERPTIECKPNGPYLVRNLERLDDEQGVRIETKSVMALCRCGGSANKPFCDGTHQNNGFSHAKLAERGIDRRQSYQAAKITIHDNRSICAHAGHCTDGLAAVFKYKSEPWIDASGGTADAIIETIRKCPSGALSYTLDGGADEEAQQEATITVTQGGPYAVAGAVELLDQSWAQGASTQRYTLCRCGASKNKPFCDGTHWSIGFKG
jgi:CDGSH-type Zn-finger protein